MVVWTPFGAKEIIARSQDQSRDLSRYAVDRKRAVVNPSRAREQAGNEQYPQITQISQKEKNTEHEIRSGFLSFIFPYLFLFPLFSA